MFASIGAFIFRNKWAQWALAVLGAMLLLKGYGEKREADGRRQEREKQRKAERRELDRQKERRDETTKQAAHVRSNNGNYPTSDSVPERASRVLFRDRGDSGSGT